MTEQWLVDAYNRFMAKRKATEEIDAPTDSPRA
jgi:hypothetical protein